MRHLPSLQDIGGPVEGLVCIVTGPTAGIGKQTAMELARRGAHGRCSYIDFVRTTPIPTIYTRNLARMQLFWPVAVWRGAQL